MQTCIPYPNHRLLSVPNRNDRALLECIPKSPAGCGYKTAYKRDLIPPLLQKDKKKDGKAFTRIKKAGLFSTITTAISLQDSRNGSTLHWDEHRSITIEEARRAQGYREHECIIGSLAEQYKIVGNGVDRRVSFPIGLGLRQAVLNNSHFTADGTTKTAMEVIEIQSDTEDYDYNDKSGIEPVQTQNNKRNADDDDSDTSVQLLEPPSKRMRTSTSDKVRYTRHSGLPVQFVPKSWNRRPEDKRQCGSS
jgi:DNA (cytosine-5)-methyltransferase 1